MSLQQTDIADLHVHSWFSDGTMGPEELCRTAEARGVSLLAVCDHDILEGSRALLALDSPVRRISGVELDTLEGGINYHILGYGFDLEDEAFVHFVQGAREALEAVSIRLIQRMERAGEPVSLREYEAFSYMRSGGGWKALHYLVSRGLTRTLMDGMGYYGKYGPSYTEVAFPSIDQACHAIHGAGGWAVLAHPGVVMPWGDAASYRKKLSELLDLGLDGVECHYPTHSEELTQLCREVCRERGQLITCGSDCHGAFGNTQVGELDVAVHSLVLGGLM